MKKRLTYLAAIMLAAVLSGCAKSGLVSTPAEPARSVLIADGNGVSESLAQESETPDFPVKNEGKLKKISIEYDQDNIEDWRIIEIFDEHNNCIMEDINGVVNYYAYEYNDDGSILKKYDSSEKYITYEYENGLVAKEHWFEDGGLYSTKSYQYNEHGDDVLTTIENAETGYITVGDYHDYEYDENGKWVVKKWYKNGTNEVYYTETCDRDESGNIIRLVTEHNGKKETVEYKFDDNGNQTEQHTITEYDGIKESEKRVLASYDTQNRETQVSSYSVEDGKEILEWRYEYSYEEL